MERTISPLSGSPDPGASNNAPVAPSPSNPTPDPAPSPSNPTPDTPAPVTPDVSPPAAPAPPEQPAQSPALGEEASTEPPAHTPSQGFFMNDNLAGQASPAAGSGAGSAADTPTAAEAPAPETPSHPAASSIYPEATSGHIASDKPSAATGWNDASAGADLGLPSASGGFAYAGIIGLCLGVASVVLLPILGFKVHSFYGWLAIMLVLSGGGAFMSGWALHGKRTVDVKALIGLILSLLVAAILVIIWIYVKMFTSALSGWGL